MRDPQVIEILVADGYHPDVVRAEADVPIRVVFRRQDEDPCSDHVIFSRPRIERRLAGGCCTVVDLPAVTSGDIRFTCGMGRYRGRIQVVPAGARTAADLRAALVMPALAATTLAIVLLLGGILPASIALYAVGVAMVLAMGRGRRGRESGHQTHAAGRGSTKSKLR